VGAIVCGSIIHGTQNLRSDIDLVIYYHDTPAAQEAISGLKRRCAAHNLDLAVVLIDTVIATTRFHTISFGFYQHLSNVVGQGGLIKHNFLPDLRQDFYDAYSDAAEYLSFKLRYVGKAMDDMDRVDIENSRHVEVLQKGLEVSINAVRSLLDLKGIELVDDSKAAVARTYLKLAPAHLGELLEELLVIDRHYTEVLKRQLAAPDLESYQQELQAITDRLPIMKQFIRENAFWIERENDAQLHAISTAERLAKMVEALPIIGPRPVS
jgi:hypothetical protein